MGQPTYGNAYVSTDESIVCEKGTKGTETSKYLQEKKETSIPKVAASEMGEAQTSSNAGVADHQQYVICIGEDAWKGAPKEVKVPYPKCREVKVAPE